MLIPKKKSYSHSMISQYFVLICFFSKSGVSFKSASSMFSFWSFRAQFKTVHIFVQQWEDSARLAATIRIAARDNWKSMCIVQFVLRWLFYAVAVAVVLHPLPLAPGTPRRAEDLVWLDTVLFPMKLKYK